MSKAWNYLLDLLTLQVTADLAQADQGEFAFVEAEARPARTSVFTI